MYNLSKAHSISAKFLGFCYEASKQSFKHWKKTQQTSGEHYFWSGKYCWRPNTDMPLNTITFFKGIFLHKLYWILKHTRILGDVPTGTYSPLATTAFFIISLLQSCFKLNRFASIPLRIKLQPEKILILPLRLNFWSISIKQTLNTDIWTPSK